MDLNWRNFNESNSNNLPPPQNQPFNIFPPNSSNAPIPPYHFFPPNFSQNQPYPFFPPNFSQMQNFGYTFPHPNSFNNSDGSGSNNPNSLSDSQMPSFSTPPANQEFSPPNVVDVENIDEENVDKRLPWSMEDDRRLARSWITISNDSIVGNGQSEKAFWKRIAEYFNAHRGGVAPRKMKAIKNHWHWLIPMVTEFNGIYNKLRSEHHSGWSDDQLKEHARELFFQSKKKHFHSRACLGAFER